MKAELTYQKKQAELQNSQYRILTLIFNANIRKLANEISKHQTRNTNRNKPLNKAFTELKRELRHNLTETIDNSLNTARNFADKKDIEFQKEVKNSLI